MTDPNPISVTCAACSRRFRVKAKAGGRTIACPQCAEPVEVPRPGDPVAQAGARGQAAERGQAVEGGQAAAGGVDGERLQSADPAETAEPTQAAGATQAPDPLAGFLAGLDSSGFNNAPPPLPERGPVTDLPTEPSSEAAETPQHAPPAASGIAVGPRKTVAFEPRRYRALEALRVILYVFAGLVVAGWAIYSATAVFAATAIFSSGSDAPQWPADVPEGTSIFDPDLTEAQRSAIAQFETRQNEDSARGAIAAVGFITWLTATMSAFLIVVGFCSYAELIRVAIDVQQNTQFAAYQLAIRN